jgi:hypothetical protein
LRIFTKTKFTERTLKFSHQADWGDRDSIPVDLHSWKNLSADGVTAFTDLDTFPTSQLVIFSLETRDQYWIKIFSI